MSHCQEDYDYNDLQLNNYDYLVGTTYLTGADANPDYEATVRYVQ